MRWPAVAATTTSPAGAVEADLDGGAGASRLDGGSGDDVLAGGDNDLLEGGGGGEHLRLRRRRRHGRPVDARQGAVDLVVDDHRAVRAHPRGRRALTPSRTARPVQGGGGDAAAALQASITAWAPGWAPDPGQPGQQRDGAVLVGACAAATWAGWGDRCASGLAHVESGEGAVAGAPSQQAGDAAVGATFASDGGDEGADVTAAAGSAAAGNDTPGGPAPDATRKRSCSRLARRGRGDGPAADLATIFDAGYAVPAIAAAAEGAFPAE